MRNLHANSLAAYQQEGRTLHSREMEILIWLNTHTGSYTDRTIQELMGFKNRSDVQPRISTLIALGMLFENGKAPCHVTGKKVRVVRISQTGKDFLSGVRPETRYRIPASGQCSLF